jgi:hypothetical protein
LSHFATGEVGDGSAGVPPPEPGLYGTGGGVKSEAADAKPDIKQPNIRILATKSAKIFFILFILCRANSSTFTSIID